MEVKRFVEQSPSITIWPIGRRWSLILYVSRSPAKPAKPWTWAQCLFYYPYNAGTILYCFMTFACMSVLLKDRTRQCRGWNWTCDLQSQVQRPTHCATESHQAWRDRLCWCIYLLWIGNSMGWQHQYCSCSQNLFVIPTHADKRSRH